MQDALIAEARASVWSLISEESQLEAGALWATASCLSSSGFLQERWAWLSAGMLYVAT